jgi:hypothetical protein
MNAVVQKLYDSAWNEERSFEEPLRLKENILRKGDKLAEYKNEEDYDKLADAIIDSMRKLGVDLIKSTKTPKKSKNGYTCYARISCAFAKHSSDEKMMQQRENRGVGSTENSRKTKTKRTTDCPCALNLIWKSTDPGWYVSSINCAHDCSEQRRSSDPRYPFEMDHCVLFRLP